MNGLAKGSELCSSSFVQITILGSGSEGNALLVESDAAAIVVDAGVSRKTFLARLADLGRSLPKISEVIVTHAHTDHAAHASTYAASWGCPLRTTRPTLHALKARPGVATRTFDVGRRFLVGDITVHSCSLPHDAPQVALVFETKLSRVGLVTDLGHVPKGLARFLDGCDTLLVESNHDREMLREGPYPENVKRRVASPRGHLSNAQAGDLLAGLGSTPARVVLMHLSEKNNSVRQARNSAEAALGHRPTELLVAEPRKARELPFVGARQLRLML